MMRTASPAPTAIVGARPAASSPTIRSVTGFSSDAPAVSAARTAKPLAFAAIGGVPVFGLPGNPVSSRVSFELLARPALRKLAGHGDVLPEPVVAVAASPLPRRADGRLHFDRVRVRYEAGRYVCERAGIQASNVLSGMAAATGLAVLEDGDGVDAGETVPVILL